MTNRERPTVGMIDGIPQRNVRTGEFYTQTEVDEIMGLPDPRLESHYREVAQRPDFRRAVGNLYCSACTSAWPEDCAKTCPYTAVLESRPTDLLERLARELHDRWRSRMSKKYAAVGLPDWADALPEQRAVSYDNARTALAIDRRYEILKSWRLHEDGINYVGPPPQCRCMTSEEVDMAVYQEIERAGR